MLSFIAVIAGLSAVASASPITKRQDGQTFFSIGQNYQDEWNGFVDNFKTPAGISTYTDIFSTDLNMASQELLATYAASHKGIVEVGLSWKDAMTVNGYTPFEGGRLCQDISGGKYDDNINAIADHLSKYPDVTYLIRIDYEVSGNQHANTNPSANDENTWDFTLYPAAFRHVREVFSAHGNNFKYVYHAVRSMGPKLYPGDDVVDFQGFSIFNNDVCLENHGTWGCRDSPVDQNLLNDIKAATKPKIVAESGVQPPFDVTPASFIQYLELVRDVVEQNDFAGWIYINSDWVKHDWTDGTWGDSRMETFPEVKDWVNANIVNNSRYTMG